MLSFSDEQLAMIQDAVRHVDRFCREPLLSAVGHYFHGRSEVGDGELHRCLVQLQHEFMCPPRSPVIWKKQFTAH